MPGDITPTLGFVGLGNMGVPMVANLTAAGFSVLAYDPAPAARQRALGAGAVLASSAAELADRVETMILMLPSSRIVTSVVDEVIDHLRSGSLVIDMSSSEPIRTRELADKLEARGIRMVDAPVSGGVTGAVAARLTIMVGGDSSIVDEATPILAALGQVVRAGDIGAGHAVKALNNLLSATHLLITAEAVAAGERFGLDPQVMLEIFNGSSGRSASTENKFPNFVIPGTFDSGFGLRLMLKDMLIATQLEKQVGSVGDLSKSAAEVWSRAADDMDAEADHTQIAEWVGRQRGAPQ
ncbi:NAD(P)-dependent oxidoreductase [Microbacterium sp.]|uniref:NAD(P)-dependent oxidoreductase n=1 Tax=Microbacterium sp. TaxID=51671 RepID=UPI003F9C8CBD